MRGTRFLSVVVFLTGASLAWAEASLTELAPYGTETSSEGNSITPDGQWIVGNSGGGENRGVLWSASNPSAPINVLGGSMQAGISGASPIERNPIWGARNWSCSGRPTGRWGRPSGSIGLPTAPLVRSFGTPMK